MDGISDARDRSISCFCTGARWCKLCAETERVIQLKREQQAAADAQGAYVVPEGTSSTSFPQQAARHVYCWECSLVYEYQVADDVRVSLCSDHAGFGSPSLAVSLPGLVCSRDFIEEEEEAKLITFLDTVNQVRHHTDDKEEPDPSSESAAFHGWKISQSGRRKQDFGPQANFKKRKIKMRADLPGMPSALQSLFHRVSQFVSANVIAAPQSPSPLAQGADTDQTAASPAAADKRLPSQLFHIVESSALDYAPDVMSNLEPHFDDMWLWGPRVVGLSLLSECNMTFVDPRNGQQVNVFLPRRALFALSGASRYQWMHGIRASAISSRRVSITMRELNGEAADVDETTISAIQQFANTFV